MSEHDPARPYGEGECVVPAADAMAWATDVFRALGADEEAARETAFALVAADLAGHPSHGIRLVSTYAHQASAGEIAPAARAAVSGRAAGHTSIAGGGCLGPAAMRLAVRCAADGARRDGLATVHVTGCGHIGRLGLYAARLSAAGLVGMVTSAHALVPDEAIMAPLGGRARVFDTNPWAFAFPADGGDLIVDVPTSAITYNKVEQCRSSGAPIPRGVALDADGRPCADPAAVLAAGSLLPAGGAIGYGLALAATGLAALGGGPPDAAGRRPGAGISGIFLLAMDVARRLPLEDYRRRLGTAAAAIENSAPLDRSVPVRVPGRRGVVVRSPAEVSGSISLSRTVSSSLEETCRTMGMATLQDYGRVAGERSA